MTLAGAHLRIGKIAASIGHGPLIIVMPKRDEAAGAMAGHDVQDFIIGHGFASVCWPAEFAEVEKGIAAVASPIPTRNARYTGGT